MSLNLTDILARLERDAQFNDSFVCPRHSGQPQPCFTIPGDATLTPHITGPSGYAIACPRIGAGEGCEPESRWLSASAQKDKAEQVAIARSMGIPEKFATASLDSAHDWAAVRAGRKFAGTHGLSDGRICCLLGNYSVGKTYVAVSLLKMCGSGGKYYFFPRLMAALENKESRKETVDDLVTRPCVVIDGFNPAEAQRYVLDAWENAIVERHMNGRPTIITSLLDWGTFTKYVRSQVTSIIREEDRFEMPDRGES